MEHTASACYYHSMRACVLDERYILKEATTIEEIASTIVHEATHARLERRGIQYVEKRRQRIEAVCIRREFNFVAKLPHAEPLQEARAYALAWCVGAENGDFFSDSSFASRHEEGSVEGLRYLGVPEWLIGFILKAAARRRLRQNKAGMSAPEGP